MKFPMHLNNGYGSPQPQPEMMPPGQLPPQADPRAQQAMMAQILRQMYGQDHMNQGMMPPQQPGR